MKHQSYIRSLFVAFCAFFVCASAMAETYLNPFAYRLDNMVDRNTGITDDSKGLLMNDHYVIKYALSGPATSVIVSFWDDNNSTWSRDGGNTGTALFKFDITKKTDNNGNPCKDKGYHEYTIDFTHVIGQNPGLNMQKVRWTIDVMGGNDAVVDYSSKSITLKNATKIKAGSNTDGTLATEISKDQITYSTTQKSFNFSNAKLVTEYVPFRYPGGVDICNDPYNHNFGAVFCVESYRVSDADNDVEGPSKGIQPGLYVFGGGMELLKSRWNNNYANRYEGPGWDHTVTRFGSIKAVAPGRVRLTDDNRLFISALSNATIYNSSTEATSTASNGATSSGNITLSNRILYEVTRPATKNASSEDNFYNCPKNGGSWTEVFRSGKWIFDDEKSQYQTTGGSYIAAPNMGFDVRNRDGNLQLIMLAAEHGAIKQSTREYYHIDRYTLGTGTTWSNKVPTSHQQLPNDGKVTTKVHHDAVSSIVGRDMTNIEYDPQGGYWIAQYRATPAGPLAITMLHVTKNGVIDYEEHAMNRNRGAIRHNHDFTKLIVPGGVITDTIMHKLDATGSSLDDAYYNKVTKTKEYTFSTLENLAKTEQNAYDGARFFAAKTCRENQYTIYDVSYAADGKVTLSNPVYIDASAIGRTSVRDFAWDFGNNLYVASYYGYGLYAFALPNKDKTVSTPCREVYEYKMAPVHKFLTTVNPTVDGADTYASIMHVRIGQAPYQDYLQNAKMDLRADVLNGCKFYQWTTYGLDNGNKVLRTYPSYNDNKFLVDALTEQLEVIAEIGICVYEEEAPLAVKAETTFPAAFVKRELDDISYSTICFPFHLESLEGTPYQGASVLELKSSTVNSDGDSRVFLNFEEVVFGAGKGMRAGKPYLIQLPKNKQLKEEEVFENVTCPVLKGTTGFNEHGGLDVNCDNGITFHGLLNPTTFSKAEIQDKLFLTADNRLVSLYGQNSFSINGLRGYFTVSGAAQNAEFVLNLPEKVTTSIPMVNIADSLKVTKYLWNGQIYIQRGNEVYDLSGARVR